MRLLKPFFLVLVLLAALAPTALAAGGNARGARLDPTFGSGGKTVVGTPRVEGKEFASDQIATAANGASYVLQGSGQGSGRNVYAFGPEGRPSKNFGKNGRVRLPIAVDSIAVDSKGRVLVATTISTGPDSAPGLTVPIQGSEAEIMRYLPNGKPDPTFGTEGVVKSDFGMPVAAAIAPPFGSSVPDGTATFERPIVALTGLTVDAHNRPIVAGSYAEHAGGCGENRVGFVVRLAEDGALDGSFGSGGRAIVQTGGEGGATPEIALTPEPGIAVVVNQGRNSPCVEHEGNSTTTGMTSLDESGATSPGFGSTALQIGSTPDLTVDRQGRILLLSTPGFEPTEAQAVLRFGPNGAIDYSFGVSGGASLKSLGWETIEGLAVDNRGRVFVGGRRAGDAKHFELARLSASGKLQAGFGTKGVLSIGFGKGTSGLLGGLTVDSKGRVLAAGPVSGAAVKGGQGLGIVRILPGS